MASPVDLRCCAAARPVLLSEEPRLELRPAFLSEEEIRAISKLAEEEMFKDGPQRLEKNVWKVEFDEQHGC